MKVKYLLHPREYAVVENERFYAEQASKGWFVEKRGEYFSKFRRGEPQKLRYRVEFACGGFPNGPDLPEDQVALYEECGWTLAALHGIFHLFCAPESSGAPEIYGTPEQQAAAMKGLRKSFRRGALAAVICGVFVLLMQLGLPRSKPYGTELAMMWVRQTAAILFYGFGLLWAVYELIYGWVRTALLCRHLKRGNPLDRTPKRSHRTGNAVGRGLMGLCLFCLLLSGVQTLTLRRTDIPAVPDGPYYTLAQFGYEGEREPAVFFEDGSELVTGRSLLAEIWEVREYLSREEEGSMVMYQDVYRLRNGERAMRFARTIMDDAIVIGDEDFRPVAVGGLDAAWVKTRECVAVRGEYAYRLTLIDFSSTDADMMSALEVLAGREPLPKEEEPAPGTDVTDPPEQSDLPEVSVVEANLYLPNEMVDGFVCVTGMVEDTPQGLVDGLIARSVLPVNTAVLEFRLSGDGKQIELDVSEAFGTAVCSTGTSGELMLMGSLVNTMLDFYGAETLVITCEGEIIHSGHVDYDFPLGYFGISVDGE